MKGDMLSSRERVGLALEHRATDRVPIAMVCSGINPPVDTALDALLRRERGTDLPTYLDGILDVVPVAPPYVGPPLAPGQDIWGVRRKPQSFGAGSYDEIDHYPLAAAESMDDVVCHRWPEVEWFDYEAFSRQIDQVQAERERCLMISNGNIFETSWYLRGFERAMLDFYEHPDLIDAVMERVTDFYERYFRRLLEVAGGRVDLAFTADDIGGQNGLLMALPTWERFIKPHHRRLNRAIHEFGVRVIYHSDGAVMAAVPGLIDMGIDVLQALQFSATGMDPAALKERFGDRLCFEGGVSVQTTLPFGSVADVASETRHLVSVLGKGGGYILGPSHNIQAGTPAENVYAMFEAAL
ncbi:MAG: uroporphyrinogen decarboxylase family protein [Anaerolineae bacterium]